MSHPQHFGCFSAYTLSFSPTAHDGGVWVVPVCAHFIEEGTEAQAPRLREGLWSWAGWESDHVWIPFCHVTFLGVLCQEHETISSGLRAMESQFCCYCSCATLAGMAPQ